MMDNTDDIIGVNFVLPFDSEIKGFGSIVLDKPIQVRKNDRVEMTKYEGDGLISVSVNGICMFPEKGEIDAA